MIESLVEKLAYASKNHAAYYSRMPLGPLASRNQECVQSAHEMPLVPKSGLPRPDTDNLRIVPSRALAALRRTPQGKIEMKKSLARRLDGNEKVTPAKCRKV